MVTFFNLAGIFFLVISLASCQFSKSAVHETLVLIEILIAVVLFVGAEVVRQLRRLNGADKPADFIPGPGDLAEKKAQRIPWRN